MSNSEVVVEEPVIELSDTTDFVPYNKVSGDILKVLSQHPAAAKIVYLNLCTKFGGK